MDCPYHLIMIISENQYISQSLAGSITVIVSLLLVLTTKWHGKHTFDHSEGVQKFHSTPTSRVGGIALMAGLLAAWFLSPEPQSKLLGSMLIAGLPAFAAGLAEDFTNRISIRNRLLATMVSGLLAWWLTGYSLNHIDIAPIDYFLAYLPLSLAFTAFAVGGVANSINIIDGFNGLAAGTIMICFSALGFIAWQVGDVELAQLCLLFIAATAGFLVLNFPFGKIFMGDGGAYLLGFMLAWVAVMLPSRNPAVSVWAPLLVCAHPILETVFSMWRRHHRSGQHPGKADGLHLHSLLYCRVTRVLFPKARPELKNSLNSLFLWPISLLCSLVATIWFSNTVILIVGFVVCAFCYHLIYLRLTQFVWCLRPATINHD
jgi:UDP-N-acetylmuramyl pentapeptide phosphotransferase/UDP-N-acetylglucosamine-1-phosphate transferase